MANAKNTSISEEIRLTHDFQAKAVAFHDKVSKEEDETIILGYLKFLCPKLLDLVRFKAVYEKTYPKDLKILHLLAVEVKEQIVDFCGKILKVELRKINGVYTQTNKILDSFVLSSDKDLDVDEKVSRPLASEKSKPSEDEVLLWQSKKNFNGKPSQISTVSHSEIEKIRVDDIFKALEEKKSDPVLSSYNKKVARRAETVREAAKKDS